MPNVISEQWAELLEPGLRSIFELQRDALVAVSKIPALFNMDTSKKEAEHFLDAGGFSDFPEYEGEIEYDSPEQGHKTSIVHVEYAKGISIERKLVADDQYSMFKNKPKGLATAAIRSREKQAAAVLNNAFSASFVGGDGVALCSTSHPMSPTNAAVQSNRGITALGYDAIIAARQTMRAFTDDRGELISLKPDTLIVPAELEQTAWEIYNTVHNKPGTTDIVANFPRSFMKEPIVWDYLTDADNWFFADSVLIKDNLHFLDREPLEFALDPTSSFRLKARYRAYMRYSTGFAGWRGIFGSEV